MILNIYVIFDNCAKVYNRPFYQINDEVAYRVAQDLLNTDNTDIAAYPSDFSMWRIGDYNDTTATITMLEHKHRICAFNEIQKSFDSREPLIEQLRQGKYPSDDDINNAKKSAKKAS